MAVKNQNIENTIIINNDWTDDLLLNLKMYGIVYQSNERNIMIC